MIERILKVFKKHDVAEMTQHQREALVDLLLWVKYVDGLVAPEEVALFTREINAMAWESKRPLASYIELSLAKLKEVLDGRMSEEAYLAVISAVLQSESLRRESIEACYELARCDGEFHPDEENFVNRVAEAFHLQPSVVAQ